MAIIPDFNAIERDLAYKHRRKKSIITREMIQQATKEYLERGGQITKITPAEQPEGVEFHRPKTYATIVGLYEEKLNSIPWSY